MRLFAPEIRTSQTAIQTRKVASDADLTAVMELWRSVYGSEFGWLGEDADPRTDGFHHRSAYYISYTNEMAPVATMRIVDAEKPGFHITDAIDLEGISAPRPKIVEVQRLMVHADYRDRRLSGAPFGIYGCMVKACLQHAVTHEVDLILADCHRDMTISPLKSLKNMGFQDTGKTYIDSMNGLVCVILTMETRRWLRNVFSHPNPFNRYLIEPPMLDTAIARDAEPLDFVRRIRQRSSATAVFANGAAG